MIRNIKKKRKFRRKKLCYFTKNKITYIDYKDIELLKKFLNKSGEIIPHLFTGVKNKYQKYLAKAVKRARFLGLIGYSGQKPKNLFNSINNNNNNNNNNLESVEKDKIILQK